MYKIVLASFERRRAVASIKVRTGHLEKPLIYLSTAIVGLLLDTLIPDIACRLSRICVTLPLLLWYEEAGCSHTYL